MVTASLIHTLKNKTEKINSLTIQKVHVYYTHITISVQRKNISKNVNILNT